MYLLLYSVFFVLTTRKSNISYSNINLDPGFGFLHRVEVGWVAFFSNKHTASNIHPVKKAIRARYRMTKIMKRTVDNAGTSSVTLASGTKTAQFNRKLSVLVLFMRKIL
jgi:hypothetical protein